MVVAKKSILIAGAIVLTLITGGATLAGIGGNAPTKPTVTNEPARNDVKGESTEIREITETEVIPYTSSQQNDPSIEKGKSAIKTTGVNGVKTKIFTATYKDGQETSRVLKSETVTQEPVNEVIAIGTKVAIAPKTFVTPTPNPSPSPVPSPSPSPTPPPAGNCDPNYSPCIPNTTGNALNCPDIRVRVQVIGVDHNNFDADGDGIGCESY